MKAPTTCAMAVPACSTEMLILAIAELVLIGAMIMPMLVFLAKAFKPLIIALVWKLLITVIFGGGRWPPDFPTGSATRILFPRRTSQA